MRALAVTGLVALSLLGCRGHAPVETGPANLDNPTRLAMAGGARVRAVYSAYAISLFDLQLTFLETLPDAWFLGTPEFEEGIRQLADLTGHAPRFDPRNGPYSAMPLDIRMWRRWYEGQRPDIPASDQRWMDPLFGRLLGTSPFLESPEFHDIVRSLGEMSDLPPGWRGSEGEERYGSWAEFSRDIGAWRDWLEANRGQLEWDAGAHHLVVGRGLGD